MIIDWPVAAFPIRSENFHLSGTTLSAGGVFGPGTLINVENRVWRLMIDLPHMTESQWRVVRSIIDDANGQFGVIRVPVVQEASLAFGSTVSRFADETTFSDSTVFAVESLASVTIAQDAPAGSTMIRLSVGPSLFKAASMFSLPGDRLYRVTGQASANAVRIVPPLRRAVRTGDPANFTTATVRMRMAEDGASLMRVPANLSAPFTIPMVEAFT